MKTHFKQIIGILTILLVFMISCAGVSAEYTGYIDYEEIYNSKNYESTFDENTVIVVMQPVDWCGSVQEYLDRNIFDGINYSEINMLSRCDEPSDNRIGDLLMIQFNNGGRDKVIETIEQLKKNKYVIYSFPNYIELLDNDNDDIGSSVVEDKYYLNDGIFNFEIKTNGMEILALYKDGSLVSSAIGSEIDIADKDFDTLKAFLWSDLDLMLPLRDYTVLSRDQVFSASKKPFPEPIYGDIPAVYLEGDTTDISKDNRVTLKLKYESGTNKFEGYASVKWQGNYSLKFEKKNYAIKLYKDEDLNKKLKINLMDWDTSNNYVLKANWVDSTAARNIVCSRLYDTLPNTYLPSGTKGVIDGFPIRLYLNDEYRGLYTWNKPKKGWVFGMNGDNPNELLYFANFATGSGLFERKYSDDHYWELVYPDEHQSNDEFDRVTGFVSECSDNEFREHIGEYIDIDSLLNFYVFSQIIMNCDGTGKNMNMATYDGQLWHIRPYDLDATFGIEWHGQALKPYTTDMSETNFRKSVLWRKLEDNFPQEIYDRYIQLRNNQLSEKNVLEAFKYFMDAVGYELYTENAHRWSNQPGNQYMYNQIEDFVNTRYPYLDEYMKNFNVGE